MKEKYLDLGELLRKIFVFGGPIVLAATLIKECASENRVEPGYIKPRNVQIETEDRDKNGLRETIINVSNKKYLLKYNENGTPTICPYITKVEQEKF